MHELSVVEDILNTAVKYAKASGAQKLVRIRMRIGELSDLREKDMQYFLDCLTKGDSLTTGVKFEIEWLPVIFRCETCRKVFPVKIRELKDIICPFCGDKHVVFQSGRGYFIKELEVI